VLFLGYLSRNKQTGLQVGNFFAFLGLVVVTIVFSMNLHLTTNSSPENVPSPFAVKLSRGCGDVYVKLRGFVDRAISLFSTDL